MRKALLVGINDYTSSPLYGCINDVHKMTNLLSRDFDNSKNFSCKKLTSQNRQISSHDLKQAVAELFSQKCDVALFYFSGHGAAATATNKSCLVTQDGERHSGGIELDFLIDLANKSSDVSEVVIILDCCFSGSAGDCFATGGLTGIREGISILCSSRKNQTSFEVADGGLFTAILCEALEGGAGDTLGLVTVASMYSFAEKLLSPWDQRPIFKSHVSCMQTLRRTKPHVPIGTLRKLLQYFPSADFEFPLDPSFEPEAEPKGHDNERIFSDLQVFNRAQLLEPVGEDHMYFASIRSRSCLLTPLGRYYWQLFNNDLL